MTTSLRVTLDSSAHTFRIDLQRLHKLKRYLLRKYPGSVQSSEKKATIKDVFHVFDVDDDEAVSVRLEISGAGFGIS